MSEQDGGRVTLTDVLQAHSGPLKVNSSGEHHGSCPMPGCDANTDGWWAAERDGRLIIQCRKCSASFADHLAALGLRTTNGAGLHIPPVFGRRRERTPAGGTRRWQCSGPDGSRVHVRTDPGKRIRWEGDGPRPRRLLYVVQPAGAPGLPLVVTEGESDADAAAAQLGDGAQVVGTVCGSSSQPDRDVWQLLGIDGRHVLLWPDADDQGAKHMNEIGAALLELGAASVRTVDPVRLGLTGEGDGAADWQPPEGEAVDLLDVLRDAAGRADATLNALGVVTLDTFEGAEQAEPIARGLLWKTKIGILHSRGGSGKTTLAAGVAAAVTTGRPWLSQPTVKGGVLVLAGEDVDTLRLRIREFGGDVRRVWVWRDVQIAKLGEVLDLLPGLSAVIVDSLADVLRRHSADPNDVNAVGNVVRTFKHAAAAGSAGWLLLHHEPWDQKPRRGNPTSGRVRGSTELEAAVDYLLRCEVLPEARQTKIIRQHKARYGIYVESLTLRLTDGGFELVTAADVDAGGSKVPGIAGVDPGCLTFAQDWLTVNPHGSQNKFETAAREAGYTRAAPVLRASFRVAREGASRAEIPAPPDTADAPCFDGASGSASTLRPIDRTHPDAPRPEVCREVRPTGVYRDTADTPADGASQGASRAVSDNGARDTPAEPVSMARPSSDTLEKPCTVCHAAERLPLDTHCAGCREAHRASRA